jgi:hypothetical protein
MAAGKLGMPSPHCRAELAVQLAKFSAWAAAKFPVQPTRSTANASPHHAGQRGKSLGRKPKLKLDGYELSYLFRNRVGVREPS